MADFLRQEYLKTEFRIRHIGTDPDPWIRTFD
jgi:hypothetical protein